MQLYVLGFESRSLHRPVGKNVKYEDLLNIFACQRYSRTRGKVLETILGLKNGFANFIETNTTCNISTKTYSARFKSTTIDAACSDELITDLEVNIFPNPITITPSMVVTSGCQVTITPSCPSVLGIATLPSLLS